MAKVEGGHINQTSQGIVAQTESTGETSLFKTTAAAMHWLAMDHEITESRAYRKGLRGEGI